MRPNNFLSPKRSQRISAPAFWLDNRLNKGIAPWPSLIKPWRENAAPAVEPPNLRTRNLFPLVSLRFG